MYYVCYVMARTQTISVRDEDEQFWKEFVKAARREGGASGLLVALAKKWFQAHGEGNPSFMLDEWQTDPAFKAWPTAWQLPPLQEIKALSTKELKEMKDFIERWDRALEKKLQARGE